MFGKNLHLNALQSRKQLLLAESELHRVQLAQDWQSARQEVQALARQARTISCLVAVGTTLLAGLAAGRRSQSVPVAEKPSWLGKLLKGAALVSTCWTILRPPPPRHGPGQPTPESSRT